MYKRRVFFLNDYQDFWLYNCLIRQNDEIIFNKTNKVTSPHYMVEYFKSIGFKLTSFSSVKNNIIDYLSNCHAFITKECHPFTGIDVTESIRKSETPIKDKTYSIGWLGESTNIWKIPNSQSRYDIRDKFKYHFIEPHHKLIYETIGLTDNIIPSHPKYYFLNNSNREKLCSLLNLDPLKQYVTILVTKFQDGQLPNDQLEILEFITRRCSKIGLEIIWKTKQKFGNFGNNLFEHKHEYYGANPAFHETLALMFISSLVIGFGSAASIEAEYIGTPYINFWRQDLLDRTCPVEEQTIDWLNKNFTLLADPTIAYHTNQTYKLAQGETTLNIKPLAKLGLGSTTNNISNFIDSSINSCNREHSKSGFDIHPLWREIY